MPDDVVLVALTRALLGIREAVDGAIHLVGSLKGTAPKKEDTAEGALAKIQRNTFGGADQQ